MRKDLAMFAQGCGGRAQTVIATLCTEYVIALRLVILRMLSLSLQFYFHLSFPCLLLLRKGTLLAFCGHHGGSAIFRVLSTGKDDRSADMRAFHPGP